jgi:protein O-mannosyl-transferase
VPGKPNRLDPDPGPEEGPEQVGPLGPYGWLHGDRGWALLVGAAAVLLYLQTLTFGWVYDDQMEVVHNVFVQSLEYIPWIFTSSAWAGSGMETYLYRPLATLTYALNHQISGLDPWSYHLVNVILHGVTSVLVFRLGIAWGLSNTVAGLGGILFAVHPVHVEAVAAVFGRKDLLATFFTLLMVLGHVRAEAWNGWRLYLPPAAYAAALLSKEVGVVGLLLVVAHDLILAPHGERLLRGRSTRAMGLYVAYGGILLFYLLVRAQVTGIGGVPETSFFDNPLAGADPFTRIATALVVVGQGLALLTFPLTLSPDYSFNAIPLVESAQDPRLILATLALGAMTIFGLMAGRRYFPRSGMVEEPFLGARVVLLALTWYALTILPVSNLVLTTGTVFGERLLYMPSVSFCLLAAFVLHGVTRSLRGRAALGGSALIVLVLAGFSVQTIRYSRAWDNDVSLFRWATLSKPASTKAHHKLGEELLREGNLADAVRALGRALDIAPGNEFAGVTMGQAKRAVAERFFPPPEGRGENGSLPADPDLLYLLGQIRRDQGDLGEAARYWREAVRVEPRHAESLADLALINLLSADTVAALDYLRRAVDEKPSLAGAWYNLGRVLLSRGETEQGREALLRFVQEAGSRFPQETLWARRVLDGLGAR